MTFILILFIMASCFTYPPIEDKFIDEHKQLDEVWYSCQIGDNLTNLSEKFHTTSVDIQARNNLQTLPKNIVGFQILVPDIKAEKNNDVVLHWNKSEKNWIKFSGNKNENMSRWKSLYVFVIIKNGNSTYCEFPCEANMGIPVKNLITYDNIRDLVVGLITIFSNGVTVTASIKPDSPIDGYVLRKLNNDEVKALSLELNNYNVTFDN